MTFSNLNLKLYENNSYLIFDIFLVNKLLQKKTNQELRVILSSIITYNNFENYIMSTQYYVIIFIKLLLTP